MNDQSVVDPLPWLLETSSPGTRYLALRDLVGLASDDAQLRNARREAHQKGPIAVVLDHMEAPGYWVEPGPGYNPKYRSTVWALTLLAQLGAFVDEDERIRLACNYLLDNSLTKSGQFTMTGAPSGTIDCLQGNLSWALLEIGFDDPRLDLAYEWMARTLTGEGITSSDDRHAAVRYYAGKSGPDFACGANDRLPCAWGGVKVLLALGKIPKERRTPIIDRAIQRGVDFFFKVDPADAAYPTGYSTRPSSNWWKFGFPVFYVTDLLQIVEALAALGYGRDPRLARSIDLIKKKQDPDGRWLLEYDYTGKTWVDFGEKKRPNKWVSLRALRALKATSAA